MSREATSIASAGTLAWRAVGAASVAISAVWALAPLEPNQVDVPVIAAEPGTPPLRAPTPLQVASFNAPLWVAPPAKVAESTPPPPPPPPPPLRWQLLAIARHGTGFQAVVYDPDTDKVLVLGEGDESGSRRIANITQTTLDVRDASGVRTLSLLERGHP